MKEARPGNFGNSLQDKQKPSNLPMTTKERTIIRFIIMVGYIFCLPETVFKTSGPWTKTVPTWSSIPSSLALMYGSFRFMVPTWCIDPGQICLCTICPVLRRRNWRSAWLLILISWESIGSIIRPIISVTSLSAMTVKKWLWLLVDVFLSFRQSREEHFVWAKKTAFAIGMRFFLRTEKISWPSLTKVGSLKSTNIPDWD